MSAPNYTWVKEYNKYMGGTDCMDQNVATYRSNVRSKKW